MKPDVRRRDPGLQLHPGINFASVQVGGDLGGFIFAVGSVVALVVGIPFFRWFFFGTLIGGLLVAGTLVAWRTHRPDPPLWRPIQLGLDSRVEPTPHGRSEPGARVVQHAVRWPAPVR